MKRFTARHPEREPFRGYLAPCPECGLVVVHSRKHGRPFHMHWRSRLCRELAAKRKG